MSKTYFGIVYRCRLIGEVPVTPVRRVLTRLVGSRVHSPVMREWLGRVETSFELARNTASVVIPSVIGPSPRNLTVAITANCNLRCMGCRYGRDYMTGHELPVAMVKQLLKDAASAGISTVRLYGGEPLLHPGLNEMVREAVSCGITPFVTTNGRLLDRKLDSLVDAGLRILTFGYYGHGETYDKYVSRKGAWDKFERSIAAARDRFGEKLSLHISYLLSTVTCSPVELQKAWEFAQRYQLKFHVDLVHYSLPYFTEGPERQLQFTGADFGRVRKFADQLLQLRAERPDLYAEPLASIRAIPDWIMRGPSMRVPCDAYDMIWVGADGTVRLCFVTFKLGNLHSQPLRELLFTAQHKRAALGAVRLECPNCHCHRDARVLKHLPTLLRYSIGSASAPTEPNSVNHSHFPIIE